MCGIVGIAALRGAPAPDLQQLRAMCQTIVHRGPDDEGIHIEGGVGFGMRRLSIIDLSGGKQPIFNEDRTIRTVFNGEIYNFQELRRDLGHKGHRFSTNADTEVIVHGYEEYGAYLPKYLNGMFAFAVHDTIREKLLLARDHIGIKPLYYTLNEDYFIWGSETKALLASGLIQRELDLDALSEFLTWEYTPGNRTLFKEIYKLEAGQCIEIDLRSPSCQPTVYWDIPLSKDTYNKFGTRDWENILESKIEECVRRQLVSDVPLGAFLSGGVDSSLVVSSMPTARAFSIGFDDASYNEIHYARKVATHLGIDHIYEMLRPYVVDLFDQLMYFMDDPIGDFSIFPTYLVSKVAREHVTVALSGDGGDELFGGYETYIANETAKLYDRIPGFIRAKLIAPLVEAIRPTSLKKGFINKLKRFVEGTMQPCELVHARWRIFLSDVLRETLFTQEALRQFVTPAGAHILELFRRSGNRDPIDRSLYVDVKSYLCDNCLVKVDRMSMAVSLEARVPLLDKELVELAFTMPSHLKLRSGQTKWILKKIAARRIPPDCVYRPKEGFSIPIRHWLKTQFRPLMEELLNAEKIASTGIFNASTIERLKHEHLTGVANHSHILWSLMMFHAWQKRWLEN